MISPELSEPKGEDGLQVGCRAIDDGRHARAGFDLPSALLARDCTGTRADRWRWCEPV